MRYDRFIGFYRDGNGNPILSPAIDLLIASEVGRLEAELKSIARRLTEDKLTIPEWEKAMAIALKESHIRMAILASGGKAQTVANSYLIAGRRLREEYRNLDNFARDLKEGKLSVKQSIARAGLYAQSARQTYCEVHHANKMFVEGFGLAMRRLDPDADHCPQCPTHSTRGQYVPVEQIVPIGARCDCRGRCRCQIIYRRRNDRGFRDRVV